MHPAGFAAGEFEPRRLMDRECVHVAAKQNGAALTRAFKHGDESACLFASPDRERQPCQRRLKLVAGPGTIESKFRFGMNGSAKRDQLVAACFGRSGPLGKMLHARQTSCRY